MNKLVIVSIILLFFLIILLPVSLTFAIRLIPGGIQPSLGNTIKIYDQYVYYQSFISPADNLVGIGTSIKNPNFANKKNVVINLYDDNDKLVRVVTLNGQNIADGKFVKILFEPITSSKNKKFSWSILSPESTFDDALELFLTDKKPSWSLDFRVNEKLAENELSYITLHRPSSYKEVLSKVINGLVSKIKGDNIFFLVYGLLLLSLIGALYFPNFNQVIGKNRL